MYIPEDLKATFLEIAKQDEDPAEAEIVLAEASSAVARLADEAKHFRVIDPDVAAMRV